MLLVNYLYLYSRELLSREMAVGDKVQTLINDSSRITNRSFDLLSESNPHSNRLLLIGEMHLLML